MRKKIAFCCLLLSLGQFAHSQTPQQLKNFWYSVSARYQSHLMNAGMRSWLFSLAEEQSKSYSEIKALLEQIPTNTRFQNIIFQKVYLSQNGNKESVRLITANLCGNFSLGNTIADGICNKYSKDPTTTKIIQKEKERKIKQNEVKENEHAKSENDKKAKTNDPLDQTSKSENLSSDIEQKWQIFLNDFKSAVNSKNTEKTVKLTSKVYFDAGGWTIEEWLTEGEGYTYIQNHLKGVIKNYVNTHGKLIKASGKNSDGDLYFVYEHQTWYFGGVIGE